MVLNTTDSIAHCADFLASLRSALLHVERRVENAVNRLREFRLDSAEEFPGLYISDSDVATALDSTFDIQCWMQHRTVRTLWLEHVNSASLLNTLAIRFDLSALEIEIVLFVIAPEIDPRFETLYAYLQDDATKKRPTVRLIQELLASDAAEKLALRRLLTDDAPLIKRGVLQRFADGPRQQPALHGEFLRSAEPILQFLLNHPAIDIALNPVAQLNEGLSGQESISKLLHEAIVQRLDHVTATPALLGFTGAYGVGKQTAARHVARCTGTALLSLNLDDVTADWRDLLPLAIRDGRLHDATLFLQNWDALLIDHRPPPVLLALLRGYPNTIIVSGTTAWQLRGQFDRSVFYVDFPMPEFNSRLALWQQAVELPLDSLHALANHFQFTAGQIADAVESARDLAQWRGEPLHQDHLLHASRAHSNQNLSDLATKTTSYYGWSDIILPDDTIGQLREMVDQARMRPVVHDEWGFGRKLYGRGISALFTGDPGTGKTMAAGILAGELGLDLYKVDLSSLVSKYIGETEKNLDRVFTEANTSNAVLFFDEADSIFGKRSEVKDSHDRYANLEVSYLLQRVEAYDGITILATNMRANLDEAFTRRFDFITDFPFPDVASRKRIWRMHFSAEAPIGNIDYALLAERYRIAGGNIRKIVLAAAFLAAREHAPIGMAHLLHAARREYQKMGRLIEESLFEPEESYVETASR